MRQIGKKILSDLYTIRWAILAIAVAFVLLRYVLYSTCPVTLITGFPCPGCGMTRALFRLLRLDFVGAFEIHPFIYPVVVLVFLFLLNRYVLKIDLSGFLYWAMIVTAIGMIVFYLWRMMTQFPSEAPMTYYSGSLLNRVLISLGYPGIQF